jgi:predicted CXXCH cytochrome family protein
MAAIFTPRADRWLRATLLALFLLVFGVPALLMAWVRTPQVTGQHDPREQPVRFDHRHHVLDAAIGCLYCHKGAETEKRAGVPGTAVCMGCHAQVWRDSPELEPLRRSWLSHEPIRWNRIHRLPDFVFFDHSTHTSAGVTCVSCHGHVELMAQVEQVSPLTMGWCLECHRSRTGERFTHCSVCHR